MATSTRAPRATAGARTTRAWSREAREIVDFGTNVTAITEGESIVFTATVIDPDGPDDIQGGRLESADQALTYGGFSDTGEGTFEITVSWADIDQAQSIELENLTERAFRAEFYDNTGKVAWQEITITLMCDDAEPFVCGTGHCSDLADDDENCGSCDNECTIHFDTGSCSQGQCRPVLSPCFDESDGFTSCDEYCAAMGQSCAEHGCSDVSGWYGFDLESCSDGTFNGSYNPQCATAISFGTDSIEAASCCCTQD